MAAAAALSRSRGAAGVRTTRGLFFICTLLCLVCLTSSVIDKAKLAQFKAKLDKAQQKVDMEKAKRTASTGLRSYYMSVIDSLVASVEQESEGLPDDFPPMEGFMDCVRDFAEKTKTCVDGQNSESDEEIQKAEERLKELKTVINFFERRQAEL